MTNPIVQRLFQSVLVAVLGLGWAGLARAQQPQADKPAAVAPPEPRVAPEAQRVLDRIRTHYSKLKTVSATARMSFTMSVGGEEQKQDQTLAFAAERPARVSILQANDGTAQYAIVSDGQTLTQYMGTPLNKYASGEAPVDFKGVANASNFDAPVGPEAMMATPHLLVLALLDGERFDELCKNTEKILYVGREDLGGRAFDRVRLCTTQLDADLWARADGEAWIERVVPDMAKMLAGLGGAGEQPQVQMPKIELSFTEWASPDEFAPDTFKYKPPEGAEKVASLIDALKALAPTGREEAEGPSALLGKPAPELGLDLLEGGKVSLASHRTKEVVVLDFWATWCPPCVRGLPIVSKVAAEFKDKGVVFYAVNQQEAPDTVRKFLEKNKLDIRVAMDKSGKAGEAYGVTGIPQTVLIGRDGTVQSVHVGFMPGLGDELTKQIQTLVDNKPLFVPAEAGVQKAADGQQAAPAAGDSMVLQEVWSKPGAWVGVAVDQATGETYALAYGGRVSRLDRDGKELSSFTLKLPADDRPSVLRLANLVGDKTPELVTSGHWGHGVRAYDSDGKLLWEYIEGQGVDDVWVADLDGKGGDGHEQVVIGYNGQGGVHVVGGDGKARWKYTGIGNVWHVTAGPTGAAGAMQVITTSAAGAVHVFDRTGKKIRDLSPGGYANLVRLATAGPEGAPVIIASVDLAGGVAAMDLSGKRLWSAEVPGGERSHFVDGSAALDRPWLALTLMGGRVVVLDTRTGERLASTQADRMPEVAWVPGAGERPPLLVTTSSSKLTASALSKPAAGEKKGDAPSP